MDSEGLGYLPLVGIAALVFLTFWISSPNDNSKIPKELPWQGLGKGAFARLRMRVASITSGARGLIEGYTKYSKKGEIWVLPSVQNECVILPNSSVKWITEQPDNVLNANDSQVNILEGNWTLFGQKVLKEPVVHKALIVRDLTRSVGFFVPQIMDEIAAAYDELWGMDTENWKEVNVFETSMKVVARSVNRTFVGFPLCRNEEYLYHAGRYSSVVPLTAAAIKLVPRFLRSIAPHALVLPLKYHFYKCHKYLLPLINERKAQREARAQGKDVGEEPQDFITWLLRDAEENNDAEELDSRRICQRLMVLNFAAIHTTTFSATNSILDVYSADPSFNAIQGIQEEIENVLTEEKGVWSKKTLQKLVRTDSAIRESLRVSTFMTHGMDRLVLPKDGITLENGVHLPQGATLGTVVWPVHHDDDYYPRASTYDPFRFSRDRESSGTKGKGLGITIGTTSDH